MPEHHQAELERRVSDLETQLRTGTSRRRGVPSRTRRIVTVLTAVTAIAILPMVALASDRFSDVPSGHPFHDQINNIAAAGITTGCTATTYCPNANVTRGQMAAFLNRGLGRIAADEMAFGPLVEGEPFSSVTIESEGSELILAQASFYAFIVPGAVGETYPCEHLFFLEVDGVEASGSATWIRTSSEPAPADYHLDSLSSMSVEAVDPGSHTVELIYGGATDGACTIGMGIGTLAAQVVPFGGDGSGLVASDSTDGATSGGGSRRANQP